MALPPLARAFASSRNLQCPCQYPRAMALRVPNVVEEPSVAKAVAGQCPSS